MAPEMNQRHPRKKIVLQDIVTEIRDVVPHDAYDFDEQVIDYLQFRFPDLAPQIRTKILEASRPDPDRENIIADLISYMEDQSPTLEGIKFYLSEWYPHLDEGVKSVIVRAAIKRWENMGRDTGGLYGMAKPVVKKSFKKRVKQEVTPILYTLFVLSFIYLCMYGVFAYVGVGKAFLKASWGFLVLFLIAFCNFLLCHVEARRQDRFAGVHDFVDYDSVCHLGE